jgi:AcrR family transcriptional regulator
VSGGASGVGSEGATRERILHEASNLFARRGYHATTTRQIADAVGIRQPSLFHHFKSKAAIIEALLSWDLDNILPFALALASDEGSPAVRLYRYLVHDLTHLATAPYNLSALYGEDVIGDPAFASWSMKRAQLHAAVERIVRAGVDGGQFIDVQPALVREVVVGILVRTETLYSGGRRPIAQLSEQVATLVLRGLLAEPSIVDEVRLRAKNVALVTPNVRPGRRSGAARSVPVARRH